MLRKILITATLAVAIAGSTASMAAAAVPETLHFAGIADSTASSYGVRGEQLVYQVFDTKRVYLRDLRNDVDTELPTLKDSSGPYQVDGDWIGYQRMNDNAHPFAVLNQKTGKTVDAVPVPLGYVRLAGGKVLYDQMGDSVPNPGGGSSTFKTAYWVYNIADGTRKELIQLPGGGAFNTTVGFDGTFMVYITPASGDAQATIGIVDTQTGQNTMQPLKDPGQVLGTDGGRVLYVTHAGDDSFALHLWTLQTNEDQVIKTGTGEVRGALDGTRAAWIQMNENQNLYVDELATGTVRQFATDARLNFVSLSDRYAFSNQMGALVRAALPAAAPTPAPAPAPTPVEKPVFHTVAPGEVLWQIALQHGVSVHELIRANNVLNPNWLTPGQTLYLPYPVSPRYEATVVRSGDTLAKIAVQFSTNSANLQKINKLPTVSTDLRIGQTLYVSRGPEAWLDAGGSYQTYAVQPGDTYWSIALRAGTTVSALLKVNRLSYPAPLYAGDILLIRTW